MFNIYSSLFWQIAINGRHFCEFPQRISHKNVTHLSIEESVNVFLINLENNGPVDTGVSTQNTAPVQGNVPAAEGGTVPQQGPQGNYGVLPQTGYGPPQGQQPYYGPPQGFPPGYGPPQGQFVPIPPGHKVSFHKKYHIFNFIILYIFFQLYNFERYYIIMTNST